MLPLVLLSFVSITDALLGFIGTTQSVAVVGQLRCNGYPAGSVKVKLYDVNTFTIDNFLAETHSDNNGNFGLSGKETDITTMDPKFNIYHKCNYNGLLYLKKLHDRGWPVSPIEFNKIFMEEHKIDKKCWKGKLCVPIGRLVASLKGKRKLPGWLFKDKEAKQMADDLSKTSNNVVVDDLLVKFMEFMEKPEFKTRYMLRAFALKLGITEFTNEDAKKIHRFKTSLRLERWPTWLVDSPSLHQRAKDLKVKIDEKKPVCGFKDWRHILYVLAVEGKIMYVGHGAWPRPLEHFIRNENPHVSNSILDAWERKLPVIVLAMKVPNKMAAFFLEYALINAIGVSKLTNIAIVKCVSVPTTWRYYNDEERIYQLGERLLNLYKNHLVDGFEVHKPEGVYSVSNNHYAKLNELLNLYNLLGVNEEDEDQIII